MSLRSVPSEPSMATEVIRVKNGIFSSNSYLCILTNRDRCTIIDPGLDWETIDSEIIRLKLLPQAVLCTHGHFDHLGSAHYFQQKYQIPIYLHKDDVKVSQSSNFLLMACKIDFRITVPKIDHLIGDGFEVLIESDVFRFHACPGHTPGSSMIEYRENVFTGDTLYRHAVGLVSLPGEDKDQLRSSILKIMETIPERYIVYPGHGDSGTLGDIKRDNEPLRKFLGTRMDRAR